MRILVTGGAGFIGASIALALAARHGDWELLACDSLHRRGSELNLPRLREAGVDFAHADVRVAGDLRRLPAIDALVECSAEPSVLADAADGGAQYVVDTNLRGAHHCLELAARDDAQLVFLSTSRVYPLRALRDLALTETETRFALAAQQPLPGASAAGISEDFPLTGARTLYGATKLAAELLIAEYAESRGLRTVVDRCGVVAGPWQLGRVDQGVFAHWVLSYALGRELSYVGFGGAGKQVRDVLHVDDLVDLVEDQLERPEHWAGRTFNVGGGLDGSLSLTEASAVCRELTGSTMEPRAVAQTRRGDVPVYVSDCAALRAHCGWRPRRSPRDVLTDLHAWIRDHEALVSETL